MAENKRSFLLYCDIINTVSKLPDEMAGKLFKIILEYVNDKNPEPDNLLLQIAFEPIKQQLKRDLKHWEYIREIRSENGKKGGRPKNEKQAKKANGFSEKQTKAKKAVNDNVIVNVTVSEIEKYFIDNGYSKEAAFKFFNYYSPDWVDSNGKKILRWKQKAQAVWFKEENKIKSNKPQLSM